VLRSPGDLITKRAADRARYLSSLPLDESPAIIGDWPRALIKESAEVHEIWRQLDRLNRR
jgi:hypothetical protein